VCIGRGEEDGGDDTLWGCCAVEVCEEEWGLDGIRGEDWKDGVNGGEFLLYWTECGPEAFPY
jgi:hypothetical protein